MVRVVGTFHSHPLATLLPFPVSHLHGAIAFVRKIRFFKGVCASQSKFHVTVGHSTVVATAVFFGARELAARMANNNQAPVAVTAGVIGAASTASTEPVVLGSLKLPAQAGDSPIPLFDWTENHVWQDELIAPAKRSATTSDPAAAAAGATSASGSSGDITLVSEWQWCALLFESPILCPARSRIIASHLDADPHAATCRLVFEGRLVEPLPSADVHELSRVNLIKVRQPPNDINGLLILRCHNATSFR